MNIEKMREEFEAAACARILEDDPHCGLTVEEIAESRRGDDYQSSMWSFAWWSWQASRAAIEVELDRPLSDGGAILQYAKDHSAIESLGLKVKS